MPASRETVNPIVSPRVKLGCGSHEASFRRIAPSRRPDRANSIGGEMAAEVGSQAEYRGRATQRPYQILIPSTRGPQDPFTPRIPSEYGVPFGDRPNPSLPVIPYQGIPNHRTREGPCRLSVGIDPHRPMFLASVMARVRGILQHGQSAAAHRPEPARCGGDMVAPENCPPMAAVVSTRPAGDSRIRRASRHGAPRCDPQQLLPGATSVIAALVLFLADTVPDAVARLGRPRYWVSLWDKIQVSRPPADPHQPLPIDFLNSARTGAPSAPGISSGRASIS